MFLRYVFLLFGMCSAAAQASPVCASLAGSWSGTVQLTTMATPAGGLSACPYVYFTGMDYGVYAGSSGAVTQAQQTASFVDGAALGWLIATLMVAAWGATMVRRQLR